MIVKRFITLKNRSNLLISSHTLPPLLSLLPLTSSHLTSHTHTPPIFSSPSTLPRPSPSPSPSRPYPLTTLLPPSPPHPLLSPSPLSHPLNSSLCCLLEDCLAYSWRDFERCIDITEGNRQNLTDARDPGGRLGPYIETKPDLRNLHLYYHLAEPEDIIILMSGMFSCAHSPTYSSICHSTFMCTLCFNVHPYTAKSTPTVMKHAN